MKVNEHVLVSETFLFCFGDRTLCEFELGFNDG